MKLASFATATALLVFLGIPANAQECTDELVTKWGMMDEGNRPFLKPGEWELVVRAKECSKLELQTQLAVVAAAEANDKDLERLRILKESRLPITWLDKNRLYQAIGEKQNELQSKYQQARLAVDDEKCAPVIADIKVPSDFADARLETSDSTLTLNRFLCAAAVHTGEVTITASSPDTYNVAFSGGYLKFRLNRPSRYLKGVSKTTAVVAIGNEQGEEPADINVLQFLFGRFMISYSQYLNQ